MVMVAIKRSIRILLSPKKEFEELNNRTFEEVIWDYMRLLILVALAAGLSSLIYAIVRALYLDISLDIDIQYLRMINYSFGRATSLMFFYVFAGTFILFFISMILKPVFKKIKYTSFLKILFYSLTPLLLFSWLFSNPLPLLIWSVFLMIIGLKNYRSVQIENSIDKRY